MAERYRIHLYVEVSDPMIDAYEWDDVARRLKNRLLRSASKPLDKEGRLRIQHVEIDTAEEPDG